MANICRFRTKIRITAAADAAALKQLGDSEQFLDVLVSHFHEEVTCTGRSRKKSRKQQEAERDVVWLALPCQFRSVPVLLHVVGPIF